MGWFSRWRRRRAQRRVDEWQRFIRGIQGVSVDQGLLDVVNRWWNTRLSYRPDSEDNTWKDPAWALRDGFGDCEDFAIGKMQTLIHCGVASEQLRLIHVDTPHGAHMVLGFYPDGFDLSPHVLDNLNDMIRPLDQLSSYQPVYSVNAEGVEQGGSLLGHTSSKWNDLQERLA